MIGTLKDRRKDLEEQYPVWENHTLYSLFKAKADKCPNEIFLITERESFTYRRILEKIHEIAGALKKSGVREGTRVAVQLGNGVEFVGLTFALSCLGAVKIIISTELGSIERDFQLSNGDPFMFIKEEKSGVVVLFRSSEKKPDMMWEEFLKTRDREDLIPAAFADRICDIMYTSGSSGLPKGTTLTDDMLLRSAYASCVNRGFEFKRRIYVPLPLFHVYGYVEGMLAAILVEGSIIIGGKKFVPKDGIRYMETHRANDVLSVPSMMMSLLRCEELEQADLSSLHAVYCSASSSPEWLWATIREKFEVEDVITGYGMTEVCGASMQTSPCDGDQILIHRVGKVLYGGAAGVPEWKGNIIDYRVVDSETGQDVRDGCEGELWCKGPVVTRGYFHNGAANNAAFTKDGWFKTGDIGRFDSKGYLELFGRLTDIYKINGENVAPKFIEQIISKCEVVSHVEVVGVPDAKTGEIGVAFIELKKGEDPEHAREVIDCHCKETLARFQIPKCYYFIEPGAWPTTGSGKISKRLLKERLLSS